MSRFIGVLTFDAITTFEEFQQIITALLHTDFKFEIVSDPHEISPKFSKWQIIITKEEKES